MPRASGLRIQDSLYGIVDLSPTERGVVDSPSFQRLLSVKQLGFAYSVFPGADYSRFAHCIGASHIMQKMLHYLHESRTVELDDARRNTYRLSALLHDLGHYPFSHAVEHAIERRYEANLATGSPGAEYLDHEKVGGELLKRDAKIRAAIESADLSVEAIGRVFLKADPTSLSNLLSSDVDADRLDYLARTAHHTGLPFGSIDQEYIVREVRVDDDNQICWEPRALAALDHLLISRFYDYHQAVHNKTVVGLEEVLKDLIFVLTDSAIGGKCLDLSADGVRGMIDRGEWYSFDDHMIFERIKWLKEDVGSLAGYPTLREKCTALIDRKPPRRVAEVGAFLPASFGTIFESLVRSASSLKSRWADDFDIHESLWWIWSCDRSFTSYAGMNLPVDEDQNASKLVRLYDRNKRNSSFAIAHAQSVIGQLYNKWRFAVRVYVLIDRNDARRGKIEERVVSDLENLWEEHLERYSGPQPSLLDVEDVSESA